MNCWQAAAAAAAAAEAGRQTDSSVASKLALAVEFDAPLVADPTDPDPDLTRLVPTTVDDEDVFRLLAGCELNDVDWCWCGWCSGTAEYV